MLNTAIKMGGNAQSSARHTKNYLVRSYYSDVTSDEATNGYIELLVGVDNCEKIRSSLREKSTDRLIDMLSRIYDDEYSDKRRAIHLCLHEELTDRKIAPFWRRPMLLKYDKAIGYTCTEKRYMNDLQIADMYWVHVSRPSHRTDGYYAYGRYKDVFNSDEFSYDHADKIALWGKGPAHKAGEKALRLDETIQEELAVIRNNSIQTKMRRVVEKSVQLEILLNEGARRNPHRGNKTLQVIPKRVKCWLAHKLASGSPTRALGIYLVMTGEKANISTFRNQLNKTKNALSEVTNKVHDFF